MNSLEDSLLNWKFEIDSIKPDLFRAVEKEEKKKNNIQIVDVVKDEE